jgi:hypothetical protein
MSANPVTPPTTNSTQTTEELLRHYLDTYAANERAIKAMLDKYGINDHFGEDFDEHGAGPMTIVERVELMCEHCSYMAKRDSFQTAGLKKLRARLKYVREQYTKEQEDRRALARELKSQAEINIEGVRKALDQLSVHIASSEPNNTIVQRVTNLVAALNTSEERANKDAHRLQNTIDELKRTLKAPQHPLRASDEAAILHLASGHLKGRGYFATADVCASVAFSIQADKRVNPIG